MTVPKQSTQMLQTESMVDDDVDHDDVFQKELPVQCAHDSEEVNAVDMATDVNGVPSKDSDHTIDAGHSSQEIDVQIDVENSNIDESNIHDSSKTNDGNAEQTELMVDDDVEQNDISQNIIQGLQTKTVSDDVGMEKADETTNVSGETTIIDPGKELSIRRC